MVNRLTGPFQRGYRLQNLGGLNNPSYHYAAKPDTKRQQWTKTDHTSPQYLAQYTNMNVNLHDFLDARWNN